MTYLALARKWRPKNFTEVMGQSHVVTALSNALNSGRVHHAFLFTGTRGVGKTTLARIFAKSLNCEQGMSATPCGECSICINIDQGSFIDLIEVDAASRTGIDDMRELLDNIQYAPTQGRVKVYLIDEIHMLSKSSFNALLKTLEEPPEHVKFLFATTDPQKLPVTVLSRCLQFNLKALQPEEISQQIAHILKAEGISFDDNGVELIARAADGSLRDALSLLEQAIAQGGGTVDAESVRTMLGTVKASHMDELLTAIIQSNTEAALSTIHSMATYAADFSAALDQLLIEFHNIALAQIATDSLAYKVTDVEKYQSYSQQISSEDVQLCYQIALIAKRDIALAPDYRSGFEMAILRIIAFKPVDDSNLKAVKLEKKVKEEDLKSISNASINNITETKNKAESAPVPVENTISQVTKSIATPITTPIIEPTIESAVVPTIESASPKIISQQPEKTQKQFEQYEKQAPQAPSISRTPEKQDENQNLKGNHPSLQSIPATPLGHAKPSSSSLNSSALTPDNGRQEPSKPQVNQHDVSVRKEDPSIDSTSNVPHNFKGQEPQLRSQIEPQLETPLEPQLPKESTQTKTNHVVGTNHDHAAGADHIINNDVSRNTAEDYIISEPVQTNSSKIQTQNNPVTQADELSKSLNDASSNQSDEENSSQNLPQAPVSQWAGFVEQLQLNGLVRELAMNMACADVQTEPMHLSLDPNFEYMKNASREEAIIAEVRKLRGANYQVEIVVETTVNETPAERIKRLVDEHQQNTEQQVQENPAVQSMMQAFDLSIDKSSIKPK